MKIFKGTGPFFFFLCIGTRLLPNNNSLSPSTIQLNPMKHDKTRPSRTMKRPYLSIFKKITMMLYHGSFLSQFFLMLTFLLQTLQKICLLMEQAPGPSSRFNGRINGLKYWIKCGITPLSCTKVSRTRCVLKSLPPMEIFVFDKNHGYWSLNF